MGGKSKVVKPEGYDENQAAIARQNLSNETEMRTLMYNTGMAGAVSQAQYANMESVNNRMIEEMSNAQSTISNYENQERRRMFHAKTGSGQVTEADTAITSEMYESAKGILKAGSAGWDDEREGAMNVGDAGWGAKSGSLEDYIAAGSYATSAREAGAAYLGSGDSDKVSNLSLGASTRNRG